MLTVATAQQWTTSTTTPLVMIVEDAWGNNPGSYQAIAAIVTSIGIILLGFYTVFTYWSLKELRAQREAQER